MTGLIIPLLILQGFCFYHVYKNKNESYWYIIIILLPLIGALAYFFVQFYNKRNVEVAMDVDLPNPIVESNQRLDRLQSEVDFADTVDNKIRLSDEYMRKENYEKALEILDSCVTKLTEDDEELLKKLLVANYKNAQYLNALQLGKRMAKEKYFPNSIEKTYFAWSYFELHDDDKANEIFQEMNIPNTNYYQRKEYAKFLKEINKNDEAQTVLQELLEEISQMDAYEKKLNAPLQKEIKNLAK